MLPRLPGWPGSLSSLDGAVIMEVAMQWHNEPASWQRTAGVLHVDADPGTDFWRVTGYGYTRDNGHLYGQVTPGDVHVAAVVRGGVRGQDDQGGLMVRADERGRL